MRPARRFIIPLITARVVWNAPLRLASSTASQSASVSRSRMLSRVRPGVVDQDVDRARAPARRRRWRPRPGPPGPRRRPRPAARSPSSAATARARACSRPTTATLAPARVERPRDGEPDAAGAAGDEGGLAGEVDGRSSPRNVSTSSAVPSVTAVAPGTIRLSSPASTFPGPISTKVAPGRQRGGAPACTPPSGPAP